MALIDYPETLPRPALAGNQMQGGATFQRSRFEYATRQRKTYCADYMVKFRFTCRSKEQMLAFKDFYYQTLSHGVSVFNAPWLIEGDSEVKEFRFASTYSVVELTKEIWAVTAEFQMITRVKELGIGKYLLLDLPLLGSLVPRKSANPATDVTFTRTTAATYIDRNGVLQYAAINEARFEAEGLLSECLSENLFLHSNDFTNAAWIKENSTVTINELIENTATDSHRISQSITLAANEVFSGYIELKGNTRDKALLFLYDGVGRKLQVIADLTNKTLTFFTGSGTFNLKELADGWVGISLSSVTSATGTVGSLHVSLLDANNNENYAGDGVSSVFLRRGQLENKAFSTSPIETTTAPVTRAGDVTSVVTHGNIPNLKDGFTFFWEGTIVFKEDDTVIQPIIINKFSFNKAFRIYNYNNAIRAAIHNETTTIIEAPMPSSAKIKIVVTGDENGIVKMYVNNVLAGTVDMSNVIDIPLADLTYIGSNNGTPNTNSVIHTKIFKTWSAPLSFEDIALL